MSDIASKLLWRTSFGSGSDALISKDMVREAAAEITRLRAELAGKWLPIETAPKDRTDILILNDNGKSWVGWFSPVLGQWEWEISVSYTHLTLPTILRV